MELAHSNEQSYQLELHAYRTIFLDFKYKPPRIIFVEIGISNKVPTTPSMVQPIAIAKLVTLKGGIGLEIMPLLVQTFSIHVQVAIVTNEPMKGSEKSAKE
jgi:hypothetical protein